MVPRTLENLENLGITWDLNYDLENLENLGITWDFGAWAVKITWNFNCRKIAGKLPQNFNCRKIAAKFQLPLNFNCREKIFWDFSKIRPGKPGNNLGFHFLKVLGTMTISMTDYVWWWTWYQDPLVLCLLAPLSLLHNISRRIFLEGGRNPEMGRYWWFINFLFIFFYYFILCYTIHLFIYSFIY